MVLETAGSFVRALEAVVAPRTIPLREADDLVETAVALGAVVAPRRMPDERPEAEAAAGRAMPEAPPRDEDGLVPETGVRAAVVAPRSIPLPRGLSAARVAAPD